MSPTMNMPMQSSTRLDGDELFLGVDMRDARTLAPGLLNDARNLRFYDFVPQTRKGVIKPGWANRVDATTSDLINPWGTIYGAGTFRDPDSRAWGLLAADGRAWRLLPYNQAQSIPLPPGVKLLGPVRFCQAFDNVYAFRGRFLAPLRMTDFDSGFADIVAHWDGTATAVNDERAYGPFEAVDTMTSAGNTVTVVTTQPHGFITGADITHLGSDQSEYNVRANITVVDELTYTFAFAGSATSPATGTIKASNMIRYWKAAGTLLTLTSLTSSSTTATATKTAHGLTDNQSVTIAGASPDEYNGTYTIHKIDNDSFSYTFAGSGTSPATGTITARDNVHTAAGSNPEDNPDDWTRVWNILPNADNALYINNRMLVPTAYEPSSADNYATFNGGTYKKKDYIVATDYLDDIHFDFSNEFRINQGSADEIVDLAKFNESTVVVWKDASWGVLSNVSLDLSQLTLDFRNTEYGLAAIGAWTMAGSDLYFFATKRGVVSVRQSEFSVLIGVDLPLSAPIQKLIDRIDWTLSDGIRMANWDSKLYCAAPMNDGGAQIDTQNTILVYDLVAAAKGNTNLLTVYGWLPRDTGTAICPMEFFKMPVDKLERLFFAGADGFVNLMEESYDGDEVAVEGTDNGLGREEIETYALTRGYLKTDTRLSKPIEGSLVLQTLNPSYSAGLVFSGVNKKTVLATDRTRDNTKYFCPWDAPRWDETNVNDDHDTPEREDYTVEVPVAGLNLGSGVEVDRFQEAIHNLRLNGRQGRSFQIEVTNTMGRVKLLAVLVEAADGRERKGVLT